MAGSPASEPAVGVRPPRGAKLPARLPQPHLGQGKWWGRAAGSTPVHPALSLTQHSSFHLIIYVLSLNDSCIHAPGHLSLFNILFSMNGPWSWQGFSALVNPP